MYALQRYTYDLNEFYVYMIYLPSGSWSGSIIWFLVLLLAHQILKGESVLLTIMDQTHIWVQKRRNTVQATGMSKHISLPVNITSPALATTAFFVLF